MVVNTSYKISVAVQGPHDEDWRKAKIDGTR